MELWACVLRRTDREPLRGQRGFLAMSPCHMSPQTHKVRNGVLLLNFCPFSLETNKTTTPPLGPIPKLSAKS